MLGGGQSCGPKDHVLDGSPYFRHLANTIEHFVLMPISLDTCSYLAYCSLVCRFFYQVFSVCLCINQQNSSGREMSRETLDIHKFKKSSNNFPRNVSQYVLNRQVCIVVVLLEHRNAVSLCWFLSLWLYLELQPVPSNVVITLFVNHPSYCAQ